MEQNQNVKIHGYYGHFNGCELMSPKQFIGLRLHMAKEHFNDRIEKEAQSKLDVHGDHLKEDISSCMANWNCSIPKLKASGDLVHHYGIYHGLVDKYFKEFGYQWISRNLGSMFLVENKCPYDDLNFVNNAELVD